MFWRKRAAPASPVGDAELMEQVRGVQAPAHIAIIMDGNGRWATSRGLPRIAGHYEGVKTARAIVKAADAIGVKYLTLYAFSTENWSRPEDEVSMLMSLLERTVQSELPDLMKQNVRLRVLGSMHGVPSGARRGIAKVVDATKDNTGLQLQMAFNYGGRDEIIEAVRKLATDVKEGRLEPAEIGEKQVSGALYTADMPDPDLLIRTSGEMRISNFLLWQIAYTELSITPKYWPDFGARDLYHAIAEFQGRKRRFGGV
jgi:undecaprenyl diphosphate synthase